MSVMLSATNEDYVRAMVRLQQTLGREPRAVELARYMGVSKSTLTERLQKLAQQGLISYDRYGSIEVKPATRKIADALTRKHRIIETFLHVVLGRPIDAVHAEAHKLEHAFSDESIEALYRLMNKPTIDPHGQKIG